MKYIEAPVPLLMLAAPVTLLINAPVPLLSLPLWIDRPSHWKTSIPARYYSDMLIFGLYTTYKEIVTSIELIELEINGELYTRRNKKKGSLPDLPNFGFRSNNVWILRNYIYQCGLYNSILQEYFEDTMVICWRMGWLVARINYLLIQLDKLIIHRDSYLIDKFQRLNDGTIRSFVHAEETATVFTQEESTGRIINTHNITYYKGLKPVNFRLVFKRREFILIDTPILPLTTIVKNLNLVAVVYNIVETWLSDYFLIRDNAKKNQVKSYYILPEFKNYKDFSYINLAGSLRELEEMKLRLENINLFRGFVVTLDIFDKVEYPYISTVARKYISQERWDKLDSLNKAKLYKWVINLVLLNYYTVCNRAIKVLAEVKENMGSTTNDQFFGVLDMYTNFIVLKRWSYKFLDNSIKQHLNYNKIKILQDKIAGFDTEYLPIDYGRNELLSGQLSLSSLIKISVPLAEDFKFCGVNTMSGEQYQKNPPLFDDFIAVEDMIDRFIKENRKILFGNLDQEHINICNELFKYNEVNNISRSKSGYIFQLFKKPITNVLILPVVGEKLEINFKTLVKLINKYSSRSINIMQEQLCRKILNFSLSDASQKLSKLNIAEKVTPSWGKNYKERHFTVTTYLSNAENELEYESNEKCQWSRSSGSRGISLNKNIFLYAHYNSADLTMLKDWEKISFKNIDILKKSFVSLKIAIKVGKESIYIRDTSLLASAVANSLKAVGQAHGLKKLELSHWEITNMKQLLITNYKKFVAYALQDSVITVIHALFMNDFAFRLGSLKNPVTLGSISSTYISNKWKADNYKGYQISGEFPLGDVQKTVTPKGLRDLGIVGDALNMFTSSFRGGRNECFSYGIDTDTTWYDYDLTSCYSTIMSMCGNPDYNSVTPLPLPSATPPIIRSDDRVGGTTPRLEDNLDLSEVRTESIISDNLGGGPSASSGKFPFPPVEASVNKNLEENEIAPEPLKTSPAEKDKILMELINSNFHFDAITDPSEFPPVQPSPAKTSPKPKIIPKIIPKKLNDIEETNEEMNEDVDIAALGSDIMAAVGNPDYQNASFIYPYGWEKFDFIYGYSALRVKFNFPTNIMYPPIPVKLDKNITIYPLSGESTITGLEFLAAIRLLKGVKDETYFVKIISGFYIPFCKNKEESALNYSPFLPVINELQANRRKHPKKSAMERIYKDLGNMLYGKVVCGISNKRSLNARSLEMNAMQGSALTNPIIGTWITGFVRGLLAELLNASHKLGGKITAVTTDGFVCNIPDLEKKLLEILPKNSLLNQFRNIREKLSGNPSALEVKTTVKGLIQWTTRGQISVNHTDPALNNYQVPICAMTGFQKHQFTHEEILSILIQQVNNGNKLSFFQKRLTGALDSYDKNYKNVSMVSSLRTFRSVFDSKRRVKRNKTDGMFYTVPYDNVQSASLYRTLQNYFKTSVYSEQYTDKNTFVGSLSVKHEFMKYFVNTCCEFLNYNLKQDDKVIIWNIIRHILDIKFDDKHFLLNQERVFELINFTIKGKQRILNKISVYHNNQEIVTNTFNILLDNPLLGPKFLDFYKVKFSNFVLPSTSLIPFKIPCTSLLIIKPEIDLQALAAELFEANKKILLKYNLPSNININLSDFNNNMIIGRISFTPLIDTPKPKRPLALAILPEREYIPLTDKEYPTLPPIDLPPVILMRDIYNSSWLFSYEK